MPRLRFTLRVLLLCVGLVFLRVRTTPSNPGPALLCASETARCVFEMGGTCTKADGSTFYDFAWEE